MATLQKIRNRAGLLIGALGLALLAFILGDMVNSGGIWFDKFRDKAFAVNGDVVSTGEYQNRIVQFEEFQKMVSGQSTIDESLRAQIGEYVYNEMVKEKILDEQAEKLGLTVTREELNAMVRPESVSPVLRQLPMFVDPQTRQFSYEGLHQFLTYAKMDVSTVPDQQKIQILNLKQQWMVIENMMKYQRLEEKYNTLILASISSNNVEAQANFEDSKSNADIVYSVSRYSSIADSTIAVSDSEIKDLYNKRKNNFKTYADSRKITYLVKDIVPSDADFKVVEDEINGVHEKMRVTNNPALLVADYSEIPYQDIFFSESMLSPQENEFAKTASVGDTYGPLREGDAFRLYKLVDRTMAPDSVKLRMIVVPQDLDVTIMNNRGDSIMNVLKGGKDFATLADELNPQAANGGEVGWVTEPMLTSAGEEFVNSCFKAYKGEILKLNLRGFTQIVKVEDVTRSVPKVKLALVQMTVTVSDKTLQDIDSELNKFYAENGSVDKFLKAGTDNGYNIIPKVNIAPSSPGLPQIEGSRSVIRWAFENKVGALNKFDLPNQRVITLIDDATVAGYVPVSEIRDMLKNELIMDKKAEKIIADLKAKNITNMEGYAQAMNSEVDTVNFVKMSTPNVSKVGREPIFNVYSRYGELNKVNGPLKGNSGVYVLSVVNRTEDPSTYDAETIKQGLDYSAMYRFNSQALIEALKVKLDVEDNRVKFF